MYKNNDGDLQQSLMDIVHAPPTTEHPFPIIPFLQIPTWIKYVIYNNNIYIYEYFGRNVQRTFSELVLEEVTTK